MANVIYRDKSTLTEAEMKEFNRDGVTVLDKRFEPKKVRPGKAEKPIEKAADANIE